ncbi:MAG: recombinase family protein [Kofleriaceae bacterium]
MRAAIYARVSSAAQRDRHTIENQLRILPAFVESQGWPLVGTYVDDGRSAKAGQLDKRDGFARLVRDAELRTFDLLVVVDVDRLTRTDSLEERARILGPFQRLGIDIVTPSGGRLDMRTMLGELWVTIQALGAAEENRKRGERIKAGKLRAIAEGRKPAGPTPFGLHYDRATSTWSIDKPAAELVCEMIRRVAGGETCAAVADDFLRRGERAPGRGKSWTHNTLYRLIHNRYSCGEWVVNKNTGATIKVPRIVSDEEWNSAQAAILKAQRCGLNRTQHVYLLQSLATCGECGSPIVIRSAVKYFNAQHQAREHPAAYLCKGRMKPRTCNAPIVYTHDLDARVWDALVERLHNPRLIAELAEVEAARADDARDWTTDIATHEAHLARLERVESAIMARFRGGKISEGALDTELEALNRERRMVREQLGTAERAVGSHLSAQARMRAAGVTVERLTSALPKATPEQRRALLRELVGPGGVQIKNRQAHLDLRVVRAATARSRAAGGPIGVAPVPV